MRRSLTALALGAALAAPALVAWAQKPAEAPSRPAAPAAQAPALTPVAPGQAIEARHLLAHRAAYRLTLDRAREGGTISAANGAMAYEMLDACEGWTTRQRFSLTITDRDGQEVETTSDYATWESRDGTRLRFALTQTTGGAVSQRIQGEAEVTPDGGVVRYQQPEPREIALPRGTMLPNFHTIVTLNAARTGQRIVSAPLMDGTTVHGAQDSTTVLGAWNPPAPVERFPALSPLASTRMRIAFFERNPDNQRGSGGASTPDYEVSLRYWENGVADEMKMDFGEFIVDGRMVEFQAIPSPC